MMLKKTCPKCGHVNYGSCEFMLLFCANCDASLQYIEAEVAGPVQEITECLWCGEQLVKHTNGKKVCPNCGWKDKEGLKT